MESWSGNTRALSEPVGGWVTSGSGISQREDTELIEMNQESGTDVVRKGEEDNGTLHILARWGTRSREEPMTSREPLLWQSGDAPARHATPEAGRGPIHTLGSSLKCTRYAH